LWHEINWLLVGFGQKICLPVGRKCGDCELGLKGLCKSAERSKVTLGRKMREENIVKDEKGNVIEKTKSVKVEEVSHDVPVNANVNSKIAVEGIMQLPIDEGLTKKEEKEVLEEIANAPGELQKKNPRSKR
jgi:endonuclease III